MFYLLWEDIINWWNVKILYEGIFIRIGHTFNGAYLNSYITFIVNNTAHARKLSSVKMLPFGGSWTITARLTRPRQLRFRAHGAPARRHTVSACAQENTSRAIYMPVVEGGSGTPRTPLNPPLWPPERLSGAQKAPNDRHAQFIWLFLHYL